MLEARPGAVAQAVLLPQAFDQPVRESRAAAEDVVRQRQRRSVRVVVAQREVEPRADRRVLLVRRVEDDAGRLDLAVLAVDARVRRLRGVAREELLQQPRDLARVEVPDDRDLAARRAVEVGVKAAHRIERKLRHRLDAVLQRDVVARIARRIGVEVPSRAHRATASPDCRAATTGPWSPGAAAARTRRRGTTLPAARARAASAHPGRCWRFVWKLSSPPVICRRVISSAICWRVIFVVPRASMLPASSPADRPAIQCLLIAPAEVGLHVHGLAAVLLRQQRDLQVAEREPLRALVDVGLRRIERLGG